MTRTESKRPPIRLFNILVAVIALIAGALVVWNGAMLRADHARATELDTARQAVAALLQSRIETERSRLEQQRALAALVDAVQAGRSTEALALLAGDAIEPDAVEIHPADLGPAFANAGQFGYGKLGVLHAALDADAVRIAVVREANRPWLALAAPIRAGDTVLALAYVRRPLELLAQPLREGTPPGTYLALRQGGRSLVESGNPDLAGAAELGAIALEDTPLRVAGAAPFAARGTWGGGGLVELVAGLLVIGFGLLLVLVPREVAARLVERLRRRRAGSVDDSPTLAELSANTATQPGTAASPAIPPAPAAAPGEPGIALQHSIFRAYDIRGVVGVTLDAGIARLIGRAVGALMKEQGLRGIAVGRDGRLSSPEMARSLIDGLRLSGIDVSDVGQVPTPVAYFAAHELRLGSAISVTGSHNPPDYNGFKIVVAGETLSGAAIDAIFQRIVEGRMPLAERRGDLDSIDLGQAYVDRIAGDIQIERRLRVVVDAGSGVAGELGPRVLEAIGAEVEALYCEIDGQFPFHHPDPSDPHNLEDLIQAVAHTGSDLGIAFDGDGDRLGVVTRQGEMIYPDRLLMLFAADVLERNPGACIVYDVKCSGQLAGFVLRHGGSPLMWKTGHSLIKAKMKETGAELAGEMSGHFFFKERWYGFDDAIYAAARLLEILATRSEDPSVVFAALPKAVSTPELKIKMQEGEPHAFVEAFIASSRFDGARIATIDGLRADWPDGWGLVRASNTTPVLVLRFEADDTMALLRVQETFRAALLALRPDLELPF